MRSGASWRSIRHSPSCSQPRPSPEQGGCFLVHPEPLGTAPGCVQAARSPLTHGPQPTRGLSSHARCRQARCIPTPRPYHPASQASRRHRAGRRCPGMEATAGAAPAAAPPASPATATSSPAVRSPAKAAASPRPSSSHKLVRESTVGMGRQAMSGRGCACRRTAAGPAPRPTRCFPFRPPRRVARRPERNGRLPLPLLTLLVAAVPARCPACGALPLTAEEVQIVRKPGRRSTRDAQGRPAAPRGVAPLPLPSRRACACWAAPQRAATCSSCGYGNALLPARLASRARPPTTHSLAPLCRPAQPLREFGDPRVSAEAHCGGANEPAGEAPAGCCQQGGGQRPAGRMHVAQPAWPRLTCSELAPSLPPAATG